MLFLFTGNVGHNRIRNIMYKLLGPVNTEISLIQYTYPLTGVCTALARSGLGGGSHIQ